ncbi:type IV pilus assembly protein FimV [Orrella daihaiensis]|uniref:FimV N-terminal domain-containing protein n=1 Tax=Orrella daihaiensis TaxID=2782176 RepID=A0ABY4AGJ0_9BURK|nr:FimV/HubP family polar landmark protein [Orrella daihaiensis]UOD49416.1 hypothetical protein DHf2319_07935 [Orrella daihaiensis]
MKFLTSLMVSKAATLCAVVVTVMAMIGASSAAAFEVGHSRVVSSPGQPLVLQVPIVNMSEQEASSLVANIAPASAWQATGLKPPVPLNSLSLSIVPGRQVGSRVVEIRSAQVTESTVVDVLLTVSTSASSRTVQASIIVPPPPKVRLAADQITVQRGDTLIGIAEQFPVSGANLYQQLWALYSSNPNAFLRENMNLLKAGAALRIPDADAVRAVDPVFAKAQYLAHVRAFRQSRGTGQGNQGIAAQASAQTLQPTEQQQGSVEQASTEPAPPANDQVRLTAAEQGAQVAQADAQADTEAARAKALTEELERKQALEQNITALQGAIATNSQNGAQQSAAAGEADANAATLASGQPKGDAGGPSASAASNVNESKSEPASQASGSSPSTEQGSSASSQSSNSEVSVGMFTKVGQWVTDNTTAAIALLLALIALILAWALSATKKKSSQPDVDDKRVEHAAADFEQKLKDIDLSLDDKSEPTMSKPDNKA